MCGLNKQDFSAVNYTMISLLSTKINILIVGGGEAAFIKCRTFSKEGCNITVVSREFSFDFRTLQNFSNVKLIKGEYDKSYVDNNHIVIIATNNKETNDSIKAYCDKKCKIYIHYGDYKEGLFVTPVQNSTTNMKFALHTKNGSPKTSLFMSNIMEERLEEYADFIDYTSDVRSAVKKLATKKEIMNFVCSEDFYFFYNKGAQDAILEMFYGAEVINIVTTKVINSLVEDD